MTKRNSYVGPCTLTRKTEAGTGNQSTVFEHILLSAKEHAAREAGLPGRADRMIVCRSCGAPTASSDGICRDCADAMREERAAALDERCRVHRVRYVEDLPVSVLEEIQVEWGRR